VPRQQRLSASERIAETKFADWVQKNAGAAKEGALKIAEAIGNPDQPIFEVDAMKRLVPEYGSGSKPANDAERAYRLENNHALHPAAQAVAQLAFMQRLDVLAKLPDGHPLKQVFVTSGGCAAGKGDLTGIVKDALGDKAKFGAVWDAADEGVALENAWVLKAARERGIKAVFGYAEADPTTRYQSVLERAGGSGRVVDVLTFINSYGDGAVEFKRFMESPEYKAAVKDGHAAAFGIAPGEFNRASLTDRSQKAYPDVKPLNETGAFEAKHVGAPPNKQQALEASLRILEDYVTAQRAAGKNPDAVARGALENAIKFLDGQPPEVRVAVLESYRRILGGDAAGPGQMPTVVAPQRPATASAAGTDPDSAGPIPGPSLVGPGSGHAVTKPAAGKSALIGIDQNHFDPQASAESMTAQLQRDGVPRQQKLTASERAAETSFADWVQTHATAAKEGALKLAEAIGNPDQPIFEVDAMKRLLPEYGTGSKPANDAERKFRLENNHALHPAAAALAQLAFMARLDVLQKLPDGHPLKQVFVTSGGCAAGKGDLTGIVKDALGEKATFGAVWDAAGEGDGLETAWVLKAAEARGIKTVLGYAEADPTTRYQSVLERAGGSGRVVDVLTFINSYADGAAEFKKFMSSPEFLKAQEDGHAAAFGIAPGEFNRASLTDRSQKAYPDVKPLNDSGRLEARHIGDPPGKQQALEASLKILEDYVAAQRAAGKDPTAVARGALENALKFLDTQPPAIRAAVLASYARIFGTAP
jgi:hypothetical protein